MRFPGGQVHIRHGARVAYRFEFELPDGSAVVVVDDDDIVPPRGRDFECRAEGLWFAAICETAGEHWSFGLEAFGLSFDDAVAAAAGGFGERVAVGYDLEWEIAPRGRRETSASNGVGVPPTGAVFGTVLVGSDVYDIDGPGEFAHS